MTKSKVCKKWKGHEGQATRENAFKQMLGCEEAWVQQYLSLLIRGWFIKQNDVQK